MKAKATFLFLSFCLMYSCKRRAIELIEYEEEIAAAVVDSTIANEETKDTVILVETFQDWFDDTIISSNYDSSSYEKQTNHGSFSVILKLKLPKDQQLKKELALLITENKYDNFKDWYKSKIKDSDATDTMPLEYPNKVYNDISPARENKDYLVMCNFYIGYFGGAHGEDWFTYYVYRKRDKKWLTINDILNLQYKKEIDSVIDNDVQKRGKLKEGQSLKDIEFSCFIVDSVPYSPNFILDEKGIYFFYNRYELQCYVSPPVSLFIPYEKLKPYLVTDFKY